MFWKGPSIHAALAPLCLGVSIYCFQVYNLASDLEFAYKLDGIGLNGALVMYAAVCLIFVIHPANSRDFSAKALWSVLLFMEVYSLVIERFGCNFLSNDLAWEVLSLSWEGDGICERVMSEAFVWMPLTIEIILFTLIAMAAMQWKTPGKP